MTICERDPGPHQDSYGWLWPYVVLRFAVFHCPVDNSTCLLTGFQPQMFCFLNRCHTNYLALFHFVLTCVFVVDECTFSLRMLIMILRFTLLVRDIFLLFALPSLTLIAT